MIVTVLRPNPANHKALDDTTLPAMDWDDSWDNDFEAPVSAGAPRRYRSWASPTAC